MAYGYAGLEEEGAQERGHVELVEEDDVEEEEVEEACDSRSQDALAGPCVDQDRAHGEAWVSGRASSCGASLVGDEEGAGWWAELGEESEQEKARRECWPDTEACDGTGWEEVGEGNVLVEEEEEDEDGGDDEEEEVRYSPTSTVYLGFPWRLEGEGDDDEGLNVGGQRVSTRLDGAYPWVVADRASWEDKGVGRGKDHYHSGDTGSDLQLRLLLPS